MAILSAACLPWKMVSGMQPVRITSVAITRMMASEAITPAYTLMAHIFSFIIQTMYSAMR